MKLVVGLGNPGARYAGTRHNVGFDVVDCLTSRYPADKPRRQFDSWTVELSLNGNRVLLAMPQTYMNLSGTSVRRIVDFFKLGTDDVLVVCDDLNLDAGRLRVRAGGASGGQKGLQSIIEHLGTSEVARLRVGIGRPPGRRDSSSHVLGRFSDEERSVMVSAIDRAADAVLCWVSQGTGPTMNQFNGADEESGGKKRKSPPEKELPPSASDRQGR